jgi:hypothetical protein
MTAIAPSRSYRVMPVGIEGPVLGLERFHTFSLQQLHRCPVGQFYSTANSITVAEAIARYFRRCQGTFQVIHDLKECAQQPLALCFDLILGKSLLALAVVVHIGLKAHGPISPPGQFLLQCFLPIGHALSHWLVWFACHICCIRCRSP